MARLDFASSYDSKGLPVDLTFLLWVKPLSLAINLSNQSTTSKGSLSLIEDGKSEAIIAFGATVEFSDPSRNQVNSVNNAYAEVKGLRVAGDANIAALGDSPTAAQLNDNINATISYQGSEMGKIQWNDSKKVVVKFSDGSEEPIDTYTKGKSDSGNSGNNNNQNP